MSHPRGPGNPHPRLSFLTPASPSSPPSLLWLWSVLWLLPLPEPLMNLGLTPNSGPLQRTLSVGYTSEYLPCPQSRSQRQLGIVSGTLLAPSVCRPLPRLKQRAPGGCREPALAAPRPLF